MLGAPVRLQSIRGRVGAHLPRHKTCLCCPQVAKKIIFAGLIYFQCSYNASRVNHFERLHCRRGKCIHHKTWTRLCYLNYIFPLFNCSKDHKIMICNSVSLTAEGHFHLSGLIVDDMCRTCSMEQLTWLRVSTVGFLIGFSSLKDISHLLTVHHNLWNTRIPGLSWRGNISRLSLPNI